VGAIGVVVGEVLVEVALEGGHLGHQRAGEGGPPALLEDGQLQPLDAAVRVGSAGLDEALAGTELVDGVAELLGAELRAIVCADLAQAPAGRLEFAGDAVEELAGVAGPGVALRGAELRPGKRRGDVDRGVLPAGAFGAGEPADVEAVELDLLAGLCGLDVALGGGSSGLRS